MKLTLLGTGDPVPNPRRAGPSQVLQCDGILVLIDCGSGAVRRLVEAGYAPKDLDWVFLTHLHSDHTIDLDYLLISGWSAFRSKPFRLVGPAGTRSRVDKLLDTWSWDMRVRRFDYRLPAEVLNVHVVEVDHGSQVAAGSLSVTAVRVDHAPVEDAFGFRFDSPEISLFISGDTAPCNAVVEGAKDADILVHEVSQVNKREAGHTALAPEKAAEYFAMRTRYHTPPREAGRIAWEAGAKKLVLTHFGPFDDLAEARHEAEQGYGREVILGEDLMEISAY